MEINETLGPVSILAVKGNLDSNTFLQLMNRADAVMARGHANLILDMHAVDYVSSGGLVALQTITGRAAGSGGKAVLCSLTPRVVEVIEATGLEKVLTAFPDLAAAQTSFARK
jgi:anti-sigma B factor antagonist